MSAFSKLVESDGRTPVQAQVLDPDGNLWTGQLLMRPGGMVVFSATSPDPLPQIDADADPSQLAPGDDGQGGGDGAGQQGEQPHLAGAGAAGSNGGTGKPKPPQRRSSGQA